MASGNVSAAVLEALLTSEEPSIVWKTRVHVLGEPPDPALSEAVRSSLRVKALLEGMASRVYDKWRGPHWVLAALADLGYPPGDPALHPWREAVLTTWLAEGYLHDLVVTTRARAYSKDGVPIIEGRARRCASQQGNALLFLHRLGLADERCQLLASRLLDWQWPDGGWNCDKDPAADTSSFMETLLPMRGLHLHGMVTGDDRALEAARAAAEVFLQRGLFRRRRDGEVINQSFLNLHYPLYWHYDILGGLKGLGELGLLGDPRAGEALEMLMDKRLPDGGWPAEERYYSASKSGANGDSVDWGGTSRRRANPWVTVDALTVLARSGRMTGRDHQQAQP
ncbi:MAG TPA: hypothetical protein VJR05_05910 [Acidimicrobiia bacterium]|nr:hypothetical protein [Acidimicrobiia bacterium]